MGEVTASGTGATGLGTRTARWALAFIWLMVLGLSIADGDAANPLLLTVRLVVLLVGGFVLSTPGSQHLSRTRALLVSGCSVVSWLLVLAGMPTVSESWPAAVCSYLAALLIARGNMVIGGIGSVLVVGSGLAWALSAGATAQAAGAFLAIPAMAPLAGVVWQAILRRTVARERAHRSEAARAARAAEAAAEAAEAARAELADIERQVGPLLAGIRDGAELAALQVPLRVTEGALRDRIRVPGLRDGRLAAAIAERRRAGVEVVLLGSDAADHTIAPGLADSITDLIAAAGSGRVTVRLAPPGRAEGASVLLSADGVPVRTLLDPDGRVTARL